MAKSFQYIVLEIKGVKEPYRTLEYDLNQLGSQGWEVVACHSSAVILKKEA